MTTEKKKTAVIPLIRAAYDGHRVQVAAPTGESQTHQSFKDETDINNIIARFTKTGVWPGETREGRYLDVGDGVDFTAQQQMAAVARTLWEELPEERKELYGDLSAFLDDPYGEAFRDEESSHTHTQEVSEGVSPPHAGPASEDSETPGPAEPIDPT